MASRVYRAFARTSCRNGALRLKKPTRLRRRFCSSASDGGTSGHANICDIPLSQPVPWIAKPSYAHVSDDVYDTHVTTLENGMRVATESRYGQFCTVGVLYDSGSRYEVEYPSGITHFLEKLAFSSTPKFANRDVLMQKLEAHGGISDCQGSKDTLIYAVSAESAGLPDVVEMLSEVSTQPIITDHELEDSKAAIQFELESMHMRPDPEPILMELIHSAAYSSNTLGLPKVCAEQSLGMINRDMLYTYMKTYHTPERMVLAGVGMDHEALVELAREHFVKTTPIWVGKQEKGDVCKQDLSLSQYTGGLVKVDKDLSNVSLGPTPMPELAHVVLGLESCSHRDPDFIAFCVLNMLMGGGGSFSAGGPGKGMYTRLYLNVLNRFHWMYNATAYNHAYADSGIFCIHASSHPSSLKELVDIIMRELLNTQFDIPSEELDRAKTQLQSMLLMNLESRPVVFEDIGRQVLSVGKRLPPSYYVEEIGKIKESDIQRVSRRMLQSAPSVAALGDLRKLPTYKYIRTELASKGERSSKIFSMFSR